MAYARLAKGKNRKKNRKPEITEVPLSATSVALGASRKILTSATHVTLVEPGALPDKSLRGALLN